MGGHHHPDDRHHHGHAHRHAPRVDAGNERRVGLAALATGLFMLAEVAGGLISGSLALLADAGHMLADFGALALAWFAFRLARRPADWRRTYGFDRFSVLVAFVNGLSLLAIAAFIAVEAAERLVDPVPVRAPAMLAVASAGLVVNLVAWRLLAGADRANLNVRGALAHVIGDLLGSVAAMAAAAIILATGWMAADPLLSLLVAAIIVRSGWQVMRDAAHILLQGAPDGLDAGAIAADLVRHVDGVVAAHHVHVWSLTEARAVATLEAVVRPGADAAAVRAAIKARLDDRFAIAHATVEIDAGDATDDRACGPAPRTP